MYALCATITMNAVAKQNESLKSIALVSRRFDAHCIRCVSLIIRYFLLESFENLAIGTEKLVLSEDKFF